MLALQSARIHTEQPFLSFFEMEEMNQKNNFQLGELCSVIGVAAVTLENENAL